ncbi:MAG TPA: sigma-70 family RNA polymerase sigma factor [Methylomirabilota bacterium]|nr:sigma-70 family RNA polymerase sigma factor [Methylomirabilota bacterium]
MGAALGVRVIEAMTDLEALLGRVAQGDRRAFASLYAATSSKLFGIVLRIIGDRALAEDILQEAFVKVWRNASRYEAASGRPVTWMAAIARNTAIDAVRQRQAHQSRHRDTGDDALAEIADPGGSVHPTDREALRTCLGRLEEEQRACVLLAYRDGYSREELADRFSRPVGTIKTWLHRGLARLRECLDNG